MLHIIEKLQRKPESARRRAAFSISLVVALLIFAVWLSTLPSRATPSRRARVEELSVTPLSSLRESFSQVIGDALSGLGKVDYNAPEEDITVPATTTMLLDEEPSEEMVDDEEESQETE